MGTAAVLAIGAGAGGVYAVAVDPRNGQEYLLIKREVYDLVRGMVAPFNKGVEDDPEMDVYEQYRKKP